MRVAENLEQISLLQWFTGKILKAKSFSSGLTGTAVASIGSRNDALIAFLAQGQMSHGAVDFLEVSCEHEL
jgi:hypothetical protein